ncbi:MAG: GNAT family N-acetyltransferase [Actinomycetota bacterium]|nr:GNAT family N-acetyltransferase [Actinomycetota bacterium]
MPELAVYTASDAIHPKLDRQIRALLSTAWPGADDEQESGALVDPALHPVSFVITSGEHVLSYGRTIWAWVSHDDRTLKIYGLGDVVTAPEWRRSGSGGRVVEAATTHIRSDQDADLAVLLTEPGLEAWYGRRGWSHMPGMRIVTDEYDGDHTANPFAMVLLLSAAMRSARAELSKCTLVLPGDEW